MAGEGLVNPLFSENRGPFLLGISLLTQRYGLARLLAGGYLLLLAYGSLYPMRGWQPPETSVATILMHLPSNPPPTDVATNLLVYVPAGLLLMLALPGPRLPRSFIAVATCALLSLTLECLQAWLPSRSTSGLDLMLNTTGALLGTLAAPLASTAFRHRAKLPGYAHPLRHEPATQAGLAALALWVGSHWAPFVPSLDPWQVWQSVKPVWITIRDGGFNIRIAIAYALETLAIGAVLTGLLRQPYSAPFWLAGAMTVLLVVKPLMVIRGLSAESLLGIALGCLLFTTVSGPFTRRRAALGAAALLVSWALTVLSEPFAATPQKPFNWVPLRGHLTNPISGILDLLDTAWPGAVLAYLALRSGARGRGAFITGALVVIAYAGLLEWLQRWQTEGYPDVTDVLIPGLAWVITFIVGTRHVHPTAKPQKKL